MSRRRLLLEQGELPSGYKRCKYLESTGNDDSGKAKCFINTNIPNSCGEYIEVTISAYVVKFISKESSGFGSKDTNNNGSTLYVGNSYYWNTWCGSGTSATTNVPKGKKAEFTVKYIKPYGRYITYNNSTIYNEISNTAFTGAPFALFYGSAVSVDIYANSFVRIYYAKFVIDGELKGVFIPALDRNGRPCMYDTVTKKPFYNQGTGEFLYELEE